MGLRCYSSDIPIAENIVKISSSRTWYTLWLGFVNAVL